MHLLRWFSKCGLGVNESDAGLQTFETSPENILAKYPVTKFLFFNPPQYHSHRHKQDFLNTTSKFPYCLLKPQINSP